MKNRHGNEIREVFLTDIELDHWEEDPKCPVCDNDDWTPEKMGLCACKCGAVWQT